MSEEAWHPDANFYEQSGRSSLIRSVCLDTLTVLEKVYKLKGQPKTYHPELLILYSQLEMCDGELLDLAIYGRNLSDVRLEDADPDTVAEWIARQIQIRTGPRIDHLDDQEIFNSLLENFYYYLDAQPPDGV